MSRNLSILALLVVLPTYSFAAAPVTKSKASDPSGTAFSLEVSVSSPSKVNTSTLGGFLTFNDRYSLGFGLPSKTDIKIDYGNTLAFDYEYVTIPFSLRYESPLSPDCSYLFNLETVYYYVDNAIASSSGNSFGYAFEFGFAHKLSECDKLIFLSTLYRHADPKLSSNSDDVNAYLSGGKIAYQHTF